MVTLKGNSANLEGLSTDQKPTDVPVNTEFRELDTNCRFYFTGTAWEEIPSSGGGGGTGTSNYNELENKPQIAGVTLSGNKTLANLGIQGELSFDNAPTEDSTNPVTSGGVYEALEAKQDTLTIDDTPTEDSTNPVTSGGVYSALENKQDNLVFDGTYDSSTNKVATESTVSDAVSTAVGNLTNDDVGLGNVTNNTQIKALSGSVTSGGIVTFGADGATVSDSGKTIETNLSNSNDNIPTSKAVRDKVTGSATMASNYATDSSEANITSSTTINDAIEQLDFRTATNKNNILLIEQMNGAKNFLNFDADTMKSINTGGTWSGNTWSIGNNVTLTINADKSITLNGTANNGKTIYLAKNLGMTENAYTLSTGALTTKLWAGIIEVGGTENNYTGSTTHVDKTCQPNHINLYIESGCTLSNFTVYPMLTLKSLYDAGFTDYQPFALPNTAITPALQECVDNGAKNKFDINQLTIGTNAEIDTTTGTVTQGSLDDTKTNFTFIVKALQNTTMGRNLVGPIEIGANGVYAFTFKKASDFNIIRFGHNGSQQDSNVKYPVSNLINGVTYVLRINITNCVQAQGKYAFNGIMICTEAEWKASQTYQPYAMSNVALTTNISSLLMQATSITGDLNNVAKNEFAVYNSSATNLPTNDYCIVRTSVNSETNPTVRLQEAFATGTGVSYIRVYSQSTWRNWLQITNQ